MKRGLSDHIIVIQEEILRGIETSNLLGVLDVFTALIKVITVVIASSVTDSTTQNMLSCQFGLSEKSLCLILLCDQHVR